MQLFDVDLFSSAGVQEMPANVVRGPEKTLAEKIAGAVDAVKRVVRAGKQPVVAWSGGLKRYAEHRVHCNSRAGHRRFRGADLERHALRHPDR